MAWKKDSKKWERGSREHHLLNASIVTRRYPDFSKTNRWALETAWIDAAYHYEYLSDTIMTDEVWDALGTYLAKTWKDRSPFFRACIDHTVLKKKPTTLAIAWNCGIARAATEFWSTIPEPEPAPLKVLKRPVKKPPKRIVLRRPRT